MSFRYSIGFLSFFMVLSLYSCVEEDNNGVRIEFARVVGVYSGESKICKPLDLSSDTTCSLSLMNRTKVILFDLSSIIVADDLGIYGKNKFTFLTDTLILNERHYLFISSEPTKKLELIYNDNAGSIKLTNQYSIGTQILIDFFAGKK
jgi:hypothetical protein